MGTRFIRVLREWRKIQWYDAEKLKQLENSRLAILLEHATKNSVYYKNLNFPAVSENPDSWLASFPILYKKDIKGREGDFLTTEKCKLIKETSSGSSGIQGEVYLSKSEVSSTQALQTLLWEWSGYRLGSSLLQLGMTTKRGFVKRMKDLLLRTNYQQAFNIDEQVVNQVLSTIKKDRIYFGGYASALYTYAKLAQPHVRFQSVISWGDKMFDHYRKEILNTFGAKVYDTYGCTEGFVIAGQCDEGNYHILSPHIKLEIVNTAGEEVAYGELGYVVVTRLDGFAMPLIRYYLGDLAVKENPNKICPCGRSLPLLGRIVGRDTDIVRTASGKMLIVHFFTGIMEHFSGIKQFRIVQEDLTGFTLEYIPEPGLFEQNILEKIKRIMEEKIGESLQIHFREVTDIKPTTSGKPQIIKSFLKV